MNRPALNLDAIANASGKTIDPIVTLQKQPKKKSREGRVQLSCYVLPECRQRFKVIAAVHGVSTETLLHEALELIFEKYQ